MRSTSQPPLADDAPRAPAGRRLLGRGRSGRVHAEQDPDGAPVACKVFVPDRLTDLVDTLLTGAVNPYRWDRNAVECAVLRRRVLERLVPWWFDGRVRLPRTHGARWNARERAFELRAERIVGRHAMLRHAGAGDADGEERELVRDVLEPLQAHLQEAGFDGLLWQAGRGNPVAAANFLRETGPAAAARWVWVDAESAVPALFPLNPWHLFRTYFPLCDKHGRWIFDDVDARRLRAYVQRQDEALRAHLGDHAAAVLRRDVEALAASQKRWRALNRHGRSLTSHLVAGDITDEQARFYRTRPARWLGRLTVRACARGAVGSARAAGRGLRSLAPRRVLVGLGRWARFFSSASVRARWARLYARGRAADWCERGFLSRPAAQEVRRAVAICEDATYLSDFAVHLAIKPGIKLLVWGLVPLLGLFGVIGSWGLIAFLAVYGGAVGRTVYSLGRTVRALARGRRAPWLALGVGMLPMVGNAAYPLQLLAATKSRDGRVARFLVHDTLAGVGRRFPIWGGRDSLLEHRFNAVAWWLTRP
jgi:hypothetical protein